MLEDGMGAVGMVRDGLIVSSLYKVGELKVLVLGVAPKSRGVIVLG